MQHGSQSAPSNRRLVGVLALLLVLHPLTSVGAAQAPRASATRARRETGWTLLAVGRYQAAERVFRARAARAAWARIGLGRVQLATGRNLEAERSARDAESELPAQAHSLRAEALAVRGELDAAEAAFRAAIAASGPGTGMRARVLLGRLLLARDRRAEAEPLLQAVLNGYRDALRAQDRAARLAYAAMAARALGAVHEANRIFREATDTDRTRAETQLEWAELFLDKRDLDNALESVRQALAHNLNEPSAHVLMGRITLARAYDFPAIEEELEHALRINPHLPKVYVTRAAMALRDMDLARADEQLTIALSHNPHDLEALSMRAAVRFMADDGPGFERAKQAVLAEHPHYARMYSIIAEYAEWEHRYEELVEMARAALALDPEDASAHATLAMNLLRLGREKEGIAALEAAWQRDHFNVHVYNLLNLYEEVIGKDYVDFSAPPFTLRTHREERAVLEPYLVPMLRKAYAGMQKRYGFTPEGPLRVEMYAEEPHFSVRTTGLPNVAVQGVCFGKVVTAVSPRAGPFNWGQITWHELAHVFHLQLSRNHVPRWFTEGLAEHETIVERPEWRREEDPALYTAFMQDRVPHLADMNQAFTHARSPDALMTAYYVASKAVGYIVTRFGWEKMTPMLHAWGRGLQTPEVFEQVLGVRLDEVDRDFRAELRATLSRFERDFHVDFSRYADGAALERALRKAPDDPDLLAGWALYLLGEERYDEAELAANRALERVPSHVLAHFALTRVALEGRDADRAEGHLRAILATGQDGYVLRVLLARSALAGQRPEIAQTEADAAIALDPDQLEAHRVLLDVAEMRGDKALALRALRSLARIDQHDRVAALALLSALSAEGAYAEQRTAAERALFLAPDSAEVHRYLGEALVQLGEPKAGLLELDRAIERGHRRPARVHLLRTRALLKLGQRPLARKAAELASSLDPSVKGEASALFEGR